MRCDGMELPEPPLRRPQAEREIGTPLGRFASVARAALAVICSNGQTNALFATA